MCLAAEAAALSGEAVAAPSASTRRIVQMPDEYLPPNKILFVQNLPDETTKETLEALFRVCVPILHPINSLSARTDADCSTDAVTRTSTRYERSQGGRTLPLSSSTTTFRPARRGTHCTTPSTGKEMRRSNSRSRSRNWVEGGGSCKLVDFPSIGTGLVRMSLSTLYCSITVVDDRLRRETRNRPNRRHVKLSPGGVPSPHPLRRRMPTMGRHLA